jgi:hypothetical protein
MATEFIYLGHDNTVDLILKADGVAIDTAAITSMTATFGSTTITSNNKATGPIKWDQAGYDTGEIRLDMGAETIPVGTYDCWINVYDPSNPEGVVWGTVRIQVVAEMEA